MSFSLPKIKKELHYGRGFSYVPRTYNMLAIGWQKRGCLFLGRLCERPVSQIGLWGLCGELLFFGFPFFTCVCVCFVQVLFLKKKMSMSGRGLLKNLQIERQLTKKGSP